MEDVEMSKQKKCANKAGGKSAQKQCTNTNHELRRQNKCV